MADSIENSPENTKEFSARLMAVQACYEITQNSKPVRIVVQEFLERGSPIDSDDQAYSKPHGILLKRILFSLDERLVEVNEIVKAHMQKPAPILDPPVEKIAAEEDDHVDFSDAEEVEVFVKETEPLLKSILLCGVVELLTNLDDDAPLIINDYLNITHGFYEKQQVSLVNGVLDKVAKLVRD